MPAYFSGLDLGQQSDFSALAAVERDSMPWPPTAGEPVAPPVPLFGLTPAPPKHRYAVRHLQRWPLRTAYHKIAADVVEMFAKAPLRRSVLVVDRTGVGAAVVEVLEKARPACRLVPALITTGHAVAREPDGWHVPKKELVSALQVVLQERRLRVAALPERDLLLKELENFKVKVTAAANETFEAWRERDHDDLVLAVALAVWLGEREPPPTTPPVLLGGGVPSLPGRGPETATW
jgi:hypothetical protein